MERKRYEGPERRNQDEVEFDGFGIHGKARGRVAAAVLIPLLACAGIAYLLREHSVQSAHATEEQTKAIKEIADKQDQLREKTDEVVYVLTLDEQQRKGLKLDMPESLRRKASR